MKAYLNNQGIRFIEVMGFQASKPKGTIEAILDRLKATKLKNGKRVIIESADSFVAYHNVPDAEAVDVLKEYGIAVNMAGNDSDVSKAKIPEWIAAEQERDKHKESADNARYQEAIGASFKIANSSEAFWKKLTTTLKENTDALPQLKLSGSTALIAPPEKRMEQHCRVQVANSGIDQVYTDLFYIPGGSRIRCWTRAGEQDDFVFVLLQPDDNLAVVQGTDPAMNASFMAQSMVKQMADYVRRRR